LHDRSRSCYDYKVSDNIAGNSTWFRYSDHGLATYKNASYKRDVLIQGYKDKFKGDNYDSVLNELYIQAGAPRPITDDFYSYFFLLNIFQGEL